MIMLFINSVKSVWILIFVEVCVLKLISLVLSLSLYKRSFKKRS